MSPVRRSQSVADEEMREEVRGWECRQVYVESGCWIKVDVEAAFKSGKIFRRRYDCDPSQSVRKVRNLLAFLSDCDGTHHISSQLSQL